MIGLDIGAVTAQVRVVEQESGAIVLDHVSASASWSATPLRYATGWIVDAVRGALDDCADVELVAVAVGATGCEVRALCDALGTTVCAALRVPTIVVNDAELLVPAAGLDRGVGVLVGSSAIAVATGPGQLTGASSWAFSDVGSASALVREAALTVLARAARGDEPDILRVLLMAVHAAALGRRARAGAALELALAALGHPRTGGLPGRRRGVARRATRS